MTGTEIITQARILVNDVDKSTWTDEGGKFLACLNEGIRRIFSERPESRLLADGTLRNFTALSDAANTIPLDELYYLPLVEYLQYRFYDADAGDTRDKSRAGEHLSNFLKLLGMA